MGLDIFFRARIVLQNSQESAKQDFLGIFEKKITSSADIFTIFFLFVPFLFH